VVLINRGLINTKKKLRMPKNIKIPGEIVTTARKHIKTFICGSKELT